MTISREVSRRTVLRLTGAATMTAALAGAVRAEGGSVVGSAADSELPFANRTPVRCGQAALRVRNIEEMARFYQEIIGLSILDRRDQSVTLGVAGVPLLHLIARSGAAIERSSEAGLFHIAFLMPTRADLARWLVHAVFTQTPLSGFADHSVSEAIYLNDPEGNGLEIYSDRPQETWQWRDDAVTMGTHQLNIDDLIALTPTDRDTYDEAPGNVRIGHMHLRVGDIGSGRAFYERALGLASTRGHNPRSAFLSSGRYHHHVALNTWHSEGAGSRNTATTGLDWFSLHVAQAEVFAEQASRLKSDDQRIIDLPNGIQVDDPWGTTVRLIKV